MRRNEREISDRNTLRSIIELCPVCRIGLFDGSSPYVVPVNFTYSEDAASMGTVYFHSADKGKKLECIRTCDRAAVEWDIPGGLVSAERPCDSGYAYVSVIAVGRTFLVDSEDDKARILTALTSRYLEAREEEYRPSGASVGVSPREVRGTLVVGIELETVTGKASSGDYLAALLDGNRATERNR